MKIFISYRRVDSQYAAGRLDDYLVSHYGRDSVFFDSRTSEAGTSFRDAIVAAVNQSDVVLPIIGQTWLTVTNEYGQRRIEQADDLIRFEIETALQMGKRVIPVFLNTVVTWGQDLPPSLSALSGLHSVTLRPGRDFRDDAMNLMREIKTASVAFEPLLGRWHCVWSEVAENTSPNADDNHVWTTEDAVEIYDVVGHRLYAKGLNYKHGGFELEGWWSDVSVSFVYSGLGTDAALKGTVALKRSADADVLTGIWAQYVASQDQVIGGPTQWSKMRF